MNSVEIRDLAIKRHDIDADHFQQTYAGNASTPESKVFLYGRGMVIEELTALLKQIPKGGKVLDVGCGTGHLTKWIQEQGYEVYGMEPSEEMYGHAVKNFPDIEFKKGISSALPYEDNAFDLIVAFEVLRYLDPKENKVTYEEFHRVLKKDGQFFVTHVNLWATDFYYFFHHLTGAIFKLSNTPHHFCNFTTPGRQEKMLKAANFKKSTTVGRLSALVRIFYKFGSTVGKGLSKVVEVFSSQRYASNPSKAMAGHLIVIGQK